MKTVRHGIQYDFGCYLERPEKVAAQLKRLGKAGYRLCLLCLGDRMAFPSAPGISVPNAWSAADVAIVAQAAREADIELIPTVASLGHAKYITEKPGYEKYDEKDGNGAVVGSLRTDLEETYDLLGRLYDDTCASYPGSYIHVGLDEAPWLGAARKRQGQTIDAPRLFAEHCHRLNEMLHARGRRMILWGDMFYYFPEAIAMLPKDVIVMDWYYYHFEDTPRVELFNFAKIDLAGELARAGIETWYTPSVWPNAPIGDIRDRLANLRDYVRYGSSRSPNGVTVINTDWDYWSDGGEYAEMQWLAFMRLAPDFGEEGLPAALADTLRDDYGLPQAEQWAAVLLEMGKLHLTGKNNLQTVRRPLAGWLVRNAERLAEIRSKAALAARLLAELKALAADAAVLEKPLAAKTFVLVRMLHAYWHTLETVARLCDAPAAEAAAELKQLSTELADIQEAYRNYLLRFHHADGDCYPYQSFCGRLAKETAGAAKRLQADPTLTLNRLLARIEIVVNCPHPSMPILEIQLQYTDGTQESSREMTLLFESPYSHPDAGYRHVAALPVTEGKTLAAVNLINRDYGLTEIEALTLWQDGTPIPLATAEGRTTATLGVLCAKPTDPTIRPDADYACFRRR